MKVKKVLKLVKEIREHVWELLDKKLPDDEAISKKKETYLDSMHPKKKNDWRRLKIVTWRHMAGHELRDEVRKDCIRITNDVTDVVNNEYGYEAVSHDWFITIRLP